MSVYLNGKVGKRLLTSLKNTRLALIRSPNFWSTCLLYTVVRRSVGRGLPSPVDMHTSMEYTSYCSNSQASTYGTVGV